MGLAAGDKFGQGYCLSWHDTSTKYFMDIYEGSTRSSISDIFIDDTKFYHIAMAWDGTTNADGQRLYYNGIVTNTRASAVSVMDVASYDFAIGHTDNPSYGSQRQYDGIIDEVWLIDKDYGSSFILTHYNNVINAINGGFFIIGPEETGP